MEAPGAEEKAPFPNMHKRTASLRIDLTESVPSKIPDRIRWSIRNLRDYTKRKDREPLIGLEYVLQYRVQSRPDQIDTKYFCEICDLNSELVPMIEHLGGSKHRKLYLAREFPFVLRAPPSAREDRNQFLRRMALEIEREEGLKTYKKDPIIRTVSIMNVKTSEARQSKRNSRWEMEGNRETRMKKALEYLETFQINNDTEAETVTMLTEKMTADLKGYADRLKEQALFPVKVARAHDVAMSIMQKAARDRMTQPKPAPMNQPQPIPLSQLPQPLVYIGAPQNLLSGLPVTQIPTGNRPNLAPNMPFPMQPPPFPFFPGNLQRMPGANLQQMPGANLQRMPGANLQQMPGANLQQMPGANLQQMPGANLQQMLGANLANRAQKGQPSTSSSQLPSDLGTEDAGFFKKLMTLLTALPQDAAPTDNSPMNSKLLMLKSLLDKKPPTENIPTNRPLPMAPPARPEDSLKQPLMTMMAPPNLTSMPPFSQGLMEKLSEAKHVMPAEKEPANRDRLLQILLESRQKSGISQMESQLPSGQNVPNQGFGQMGKIPMNPKPYPDQPAFGGAPEGPRREDPMPHMSEDRSYPPGNPGKPMDPPHGNVRTNVPDRRYDDFAGDRAPYTRINMSPGRIGNERFQDHDPNPGMNRPQERGPGHGQRRSRPFDDPEWAQRESDEHYEKRPRMEEDFFAPTYEERREKHAEESLPKLPVDVLKRIRGKDMFTVSAILSEYAENRSTK